jgi:hypothetical protein
MVMDFPTIMEAVSALATGGWLMTDVTVTVTGAVAVPPLPSLIV